MNTVLEDTARHYMWLRLIPDYADMSASAKMKAKINYAAADSGFFPKDYSPSPADYMNAKEQPLNTSTGKPLSGLTLALKDWSYYAPVAAINMADFETKLINYGTAAIVINNNKKEKNMCYDCDCDFCDSPKSDEAKKRSYMSERLCDIACTKEREAYTTFGLTDDPRPETFEDLFARLTAGKYVLSDENKKKKHWYPGHILDQIRWRDPAVKEDQDGFDAWHQKLIAARTKTEDLIQVAPVEDALAALTAFESATIN